MPVPRVCNTVNYAEIIKQIRKKKKLSQGKLGLLLGVKGKTVSAYENGRISPSVKIFLTILNVGGFTIKLVEDLYKTPKELVLPSFKEEDINQNKKYQSAN
jgi:transcriptional regulator with XRE-family HTH domain